MYISHCLIHCILRLPRTGLDWTTAQSAVYTSVIFSRHLGDRRIDCDDSDDATMASILITLLATAAAAVAQKAGKFVVVGDSGVSAQQLFLGRPNKLYFVDKTEANPLQVNGHPAWATEVDLTGLTPRAMYVRSNSFCAGGTVLADGRWLNVGGNQAVIANGASAGENQPGPQGGDNAYGNADGRKAVRILTPTDDGNSQWVDDPDNYMNHERWYPTLETLEDGSAIIFGGCQNGGYVNDAGQDNPTYEVSRTLGLSDNSTGPAGISHSRR